MSQAQERYTEEAAAEEAGALTSRIQSGKVRTYDGAEKLVELGKEDVANDVFTDDTPSRDTSGSAHGAENTTSDKKGIIDRLRDMLLNRYD